MKIDTEKDTTPKDAAEWKAKILAINDRKLLDYIRDMVNIRLDHDRAEENLTKSEKKIKNGPGVTSSIYEPPRRKLKPIKLGPSVDEEQYF